MSATNLFPFCYGAEDVGNKSATLTFPSCETRACNYISIIDDSSAERDRTLQIVLERTADLDRRIILDPSATELIIVDNDGSTCLSLHIRG